MPQFISSGAERTLEDPTSGSTVKIVLRVDSERVADADEWAGEHGATVLDRMEYGLVELEIPEPELAALRDVPFVRAIERSDESIEVLDRGN